MKDAQLVIEMPVEDTKENNVFLRMYNHSVYLM